MSGNQLAPQQTTRWRWSACGAGVTELEVDVPFIAFTNHLSCPFDHPWRLCHHFLIHLWLYYLLILPPLFSLSDSSDPSTSSGFLFFFSRTIALVRRRKYGSISLRRLSDISIPMRFSYVVASLSLAWNQRNSKTWHPCDYCVSKGFTPWKSTHGI